MYCIDLIRRLVPLSRLNPRSYPSIPSHILGYQPAPSPHSPSRFCSDCTSPSNHRHSVSDVCIDTLTNLTPSLQSLSVFVLAVLEKSDIQVTMTPPAPAPTKLPRDAVARIHRTTRENRSLWYQLTVLQQPERARACGSGMKGELGASTRPCWLACRDP